MISQALSDVKILDLTHYIAGPFCTKLLADYGAQVLKVEKPIEGDGIRRIGPFFRDDPDPDKSGLFLYLNSNKKGITLNLKTKLGKEIFAKLVKGADIVVENFSPRVMPGLRLDYEILEKLNSRVVMTSISNFGQTGPYRDYKATDIISLGMGGELYRIGEAEREPVRYAGAQSQFHGGLVGAVATMIAYYHAQKAGTGQHVDISIMEAVLNIIELNISRYLYCGEIGKRMGSFMGHYPWGIYACQDGYVSVMVTNRHWKRMATLIDRPELSGNPAYELPAGRLAHFEALEILFVPWFLERKKDEIVSRAQAAGIPAISVYNPRDILEDPQYLSRGFFVDIENIKTGILTYPGPPFKLSETPWQIRRPAPLLGQHNEEIYCGHLGYSKEDLMRLRENSIIQ